MGFVSAVVKTVCVAANIAITNHDKKVAQRRAYNTACKKAGGHYDPFWHDNYNKALSQNLQKANDRKEIRSTLIQNL